MDRKQAVAAAYSMCKLPAKKQMDSEGEDEKSPTDSIEDIMEFITGVLDALKVFISSEDTSISKSIKLNDDDKGGIELEKEITKSEEDISKEKEAELALIEKKKSDELEKSKKDESTKLDVSALKDVLTQLQELAKQVNTQTDEVKKSMDEVTKTKDEVTKMVTDLNSVIKQIPLRQAQPAEKEDDLRKKESDEKEDFTKSEIYQKMKPADKLHAIFEFGSKSNDITVHPVNWRIDK